MQSRFSKVNLETELQVYDYALSLLTIRDYSGNEMLLKLEHKGADKLWAEKAVAKLKAYGLINEERYAQRVYVAWLSKKYYGRQHLQAELQKKNVSKQFIPQILEAFTPEVEQERAEIAAEQFLQRNAKKLQDPDKKIYAAAARFMTARGFSTRYIHVILDKLHFEGDM